MAEQIISPGVFTRENDLSFLPQGVGAIGAAIVGPTEKGPAFVPTVVRSFAEFERRFGPLSSETYVPQTVREYLRNAGSVTVCRVLGGGGMTYADGTNEVVVIAASASNGTSTMIGAIFPSKAIDKPDLSTSTLTQTLSGSEPFDLVLNGTNVTSKTFTSATWNPASSNYIFKQLGDNPNNSKTGVNTYAGTPGYTYMSFKSHINHLLGAASASGYENHGSASKVFLTTQSVTITYSDGGTGKSPTEGYGWASTPFITSQYLDANTVHPKSTTTELFKFHTLDHGSTLSRQYKISIANLREPGDIDGVEQYSQFSVILRKYDDKDKSPNILEQYNNVTLDPDSPRYISRVIGDRYPQYNDTLDKVELLGNYPNISNYIRVEVADAVAEKATSPKLSPKGFKAIQDPIISSSFDVNHNFKVPSASYEGTQVIGNNYSAKGYLGFKFKEKEADNENFLRPLPDGHLSNVSGDFNVGDYIGHADSGLYTKSLSASVDTTAQSGPTNAQIKFTVPFQGGSDGIRPDVVKQTGKYITSTNLYGFDLSTTAKAGYKAYKKAIDILSNQDEYDINMLVLPGVIKSSHSAVTTAGIDMCETRGDCFYVMDLEGVDASVNTAVNTADGLDTNYAAVYYPWVKVLDSSINKPILVPPSVIVPGAIAQSDRIGAEWFAPAGLNRGILGNVLETKIRLNQSERDILYDAKINPIATFPNTGICIWGQKTLQERSTALDRINVRRLLIALKKFIASSSKYLVFEQNTLQTRTRFLNIVNPYLESVQQRQGLYAFRVVMDESNNTPTEIDRNRLIGAIYLQPTKTAEFIVLDFNVMPTGATFDNTGGAGGAGY